METFLALILGFAIGAAVIAFVKRHPPHQDTATRDAQLEILSAKVLQGLNDSLLKNSEHLREQSKIDGEQRQASIANLVKPIKEALDKTERQVQEIEKERKRDQGSLEEQLKQVGLGTKALQDETARLTQALKKPHVRGRWGEIHLRRTVELAGMVEHCDFEEQATTDDAGGRSRPDMVVHLPNKRCVVVDAKTPLDAYLESIEAGSDEMRTQALDRHAQQVKDKMDELRRKAYWQQFDNTLDFVVMFVPGEQFLAAALERKPELQEDALSSRIILATPPTLVALLRAIAYGWRQKDLEENAHKIQQLGEELYKRTATFTEHLANIGAGLKRSVGAYNSAVGSLEGRLLPHARKFTELGIQEKKEIPEVKSVETAVQDMTTSERT